MICSTRLDNNKNYCYMIMGNTCSLCRTRKLIFNTVDTWRYSSRIIFQSKKGLYQAIKSYKQAQEKLTIHHTKPILTTCSNEDLKHNHLTHVQLNRYLPPELSDENSIDSLNHWSQTVKLSSYTDALRNSFILMEVIPDF